MPDLTQEQIEALRGDAETEVYEEHPPDCHHCEQARRIQAVCTEVLAQRARVSRYEVVLRDIATNAPHGYGRAKAYDALCREEGVTP
jgi:hypothetical protein